MGFLCIIFDLFDLFMEGGREGGREREREGEGEEEEVRESIINNTLTGSLSDACLLTSMGLWASPFLS